MPLYDYQCLNGHVETSRYVARAASADFQRCRECGALTGRQFSPGAGRMLFFSQKQTRRIRSLDGGQEEFRTYAQFERAQRDAGVAQVSKDDLLHLTAIDAMKRRSQKRDPGWMRQYMPPPGVRRNKLTMEGNE